MESGKSQSQIREAGPRGARKREALLAAAQTLLAQRLSASVSTDEIVQAAGVAKGSLYNHFTDKDALSEVVRGNLRETLEFAVGKIIEGVSDPTRTVVDLDGVEHEYLTSLIAA